jgi:hypothetical protein
MTLWYVNAFRSDYLTLATGVQDDTYYYLLPAWNFSRHGWFTFDGLTRTYGFQPLWEICLSIVAFAASSREMLLRTALALGAILYGLTAFQIARLVTALWRQTNNAGGVIGAFVGAAALLLNTPVQMSNLTGKENALYGFFLISLLNLTPVHRVIGSRELAVRSGVLAGLIVLARVTPMSLAVLVLQPFFYVPSNGRGRVSFAVQYAIALIAVTLPWAVYAWWVFGSAVPTSSWLKASHMFDYVNSGPSVTSMATTAVEYVMASMRFALGLDSSFWPANHEFDRLGRFIVPILAIAGVVWLLTGTVRRFDNRQSARQIVVLLAGVVLATAVLGLAQGQDPADMYYRRWYVVELPILMAICAGLGAEVAVSVAKSVGLFGLIACASTVGLWFAGAAVDTIFLARPATAYIDAGRWQDVTLRATRWTDKELEVKPTDRIGAFSSGLIGWFSHGTVVNLDGLANDEIAIGSRSGVSIEAYCREQGIRLYIDAIDPAEVFRNYRTRIVFPNPQSRAFGTYYVTEIGPRLRPHP